MMPTVVICNYCTQPLPFSLPLLQAALQIYVDNYLVPEWNCPSTIELLNPVPPPAQLASVLQGKWPIYLFDNTDQAGAEGYHEEETDGVVRGFAFLESTLAAGDDFAVTISHELGELLCDPDTNLCVLGPRNSFYIQEIADAVEQSDFLVNGLRMSNFVTRRWFDNTPPPGAKFDFLGRLSAPFSLDAGGYISVYYRGRWSQLYGSKAAKAHFQACKTHPYSRHSRRLAKLKKGTTTRVS